MNRHLHKGILVTVSIITALIFSVSGCGMFKSSKTASPEKPFVADNLYIGEKKTGEQPAVDTSRQTKVMAQSTSEQQQAKVTAQSDSEQQMNGMKKSPVAKGSSKQIKMAGNIYVVKKGDCLWNIAKAVYNKPLKWKAIYKANKKKIKDPNLIYPNQKFIIPDVK